MSALKIKPEHVEAIRQATAPFLNQDTADVYRDAGLTEKRYRWDALWSGCRHTPSLNDVIREIYQYADDTHIDSVLRMLAKPARKLTIAPTVSG